MVSGSQTIQSNHFKDELDDLESKGIVVHVASCKSGDFKDELFYDGVTVMTSADQYHNAIGFKVTLSQYPYWQDYCSHYFFSRIESGSTIQAVWNYADSQRSSQNPQEYFNADSYEYF
ncbi:MAG: hypothetical protein ACFFD4_19220 [Candidatus Odinarchaeota archaeon]